MRDVLTRIYQKHCAQGNESVQEGVQRFGTPALNPFALEV